jgi:hypothetical protein
MNIKGTYVFYENGIEIARNPNVITRFGKRFLTNVLAGNADSYKRDIAVGIGPTAATIDDTRLQFEWYRLPILFGGTDIQTDPETGDTTYSVVYKTTLPQNIAGEIKEIGLYPNIRQTINDFEDKFLSDFSDALDWYDSEGFVPASTYNTDLTKYSKIGENVIDFESQSGQPVEYYLNSFINIAGYSPNDSINMSYYAYDQNISSIRLRFYSSEDAYYQILVSPVSGTGHKITPNILLSNLFTSGVNNPDASNIFKIGIAPIPTSGNDTKVGMDGLRINDEDTFDPLFGIISRSVLSQAVTKYAGRQLDVEYKLDIGYDIP